MLLIKVRQRDLQQTTMAMKPVLELYLDDPGLLTDKDDKVWKVGESVRVRDAASGSWLDGKVEGLDSRFQVLVEVAGKGAFTWNFVERPGGADAPSPGLDQRWHYMY